MPPPPTELVETIRSFVRRDVLPVAGGARPRRRLSRPAGGPAGRVWSVRGAHTGVPRRLGPGRGHLCPDRRGAGGRLDVAHRRAQYPHDRGHCSIGLHGSDEQRDRLLPEMASGRAARRPVPIGIGRRERHPGHSLPGHPRRRRVRDQRHQDVGDQRAAVSGGRPGGPDRRKGSPVSSSKRSPGCARAASR